MRITILILSVVNLIYLITTFAAGEPNNIYLSPLGLPFYIAIILALVSIVILLISKTGEGKDKKLSLSTVGINIVGIFIVRILLL